MERDRPGLPDAPPVGEADGGNTIRQGAGDDENPSWVSFPVRHRPGRGVASMTKSEPYSLDGLVLRFRETMGGHVGIDEPEPLAGAARGQRENTPLQFDVEIRIEDLGRFLRIADHAAQLSGPGPFGPPGG